MKKRTLIVVVSAALLSTACHTKKDEINNEKTKFIVTSPVVKDTTILQQYVCQIKSIQHIELRALERGYLQEIYVDEGQAVRKGQPMFKIMPMIYQAEFEKAEAEANYAYIEYKNTKALADSNVVSPNELSLAKAHYDRARAEMQLARTHLQFTNISAPFDGIMDHFYARKGSLIDEGDLLTTISDNSKMWVYFNVPEAVYLNHKLRSNNDSATKVTLLMANQEVFPYPGYVKTIEADFNNETGNIDFRATFPNPDGLLRHGETGNIQMPVVLKNAVIIPQKATFEVLEKKYIFVVDANNVVHQREIIIAAEMPDLYVIKSGLKPNEKILLEGLRKVADNDKISFEYKDPKTAMGELKVYVE